MCAAGLYNTVILALKAEKSGDKAVYCRKELSLNGKDCRNVHGGGESVV